MAAAFWLIVAIVLFFTIGFAVIGFSLHVLWWFVLGLVWGAIGRSLVRDTEHMGLLATSLAGLLGSLAGGVIADRADLGWVLQLLVSAACAAVAVFLLRGVSGARDQPGRG